MHGELRVEFGPSGPGRRFQKSPLSLGRGIALEDGSTLYMSRAIGAGIVQGDFLETECEILPGAKVVLGTQAATQVHRMDEGGSGAVHFSARVHAGAVFSYLPHATIPFADSDFSMRTVVDVAPGAFAAVGEILASGRTARGEHHDYRNFKNNLEFQVDGVPVFREVTTGAGLRSYLGTGEKPVYAGLSVVCEQPTATLAAWRELGLDIGCSTRGPVVWARMLCSSIQEAGELQLRLWDAALQANELGTAPKLRHF
ncbi:MAG: urease accessory protein UreD [Corynebacterium sp.]|nr:urease accessory protein UreD [Corynebacterium sp.]